MVHLVRHLSIQNYSQGGGGVEEWSKEIWGQSSVCGLGYMTTTPCFFTCHWGDGSIFTGSLLAGAELVGMEGLGLETKKLFSMYNFH